MKLYHYVHCPFCVRVRMGLKFLNIPFESIVVAYDDEKTPVDLIGKKMLPIIVDDKGVAKNESLDILKEADTKNQLSWEHLTQNEKEIDLLLTNIGNSVHNLAMPYWIWTKEFTESSRTYFEKSKSQKRGPFKDLIKNQSKYMDDINQLLNGEFSNELRPFYRSEKLTIADIMIASHLWGLYVVSEYQFPPHIHQYLQTVKKLTHFNYHEDLWK